MLYVTIIIAIILIAILAMLLRQESKSKKEEFSAAKIDEIWNGKDRRRSERFDAIMDARYKVLRDGLRYGQAVTTNLSKVGICMVLYEKVNKDTLLEIMFESPSTNQVNIFEGRVIWVQEIEEEPDTKRRRFRVGIEVMSPPEFTSFIDTAIRKEDKGAT